MPSHADSAAAPIAVPMPTAGLLKLSKDIFAGTCGGVIDCARKTVQWEGLGGLYKGVTSPLAGQMFFRASLFGAFGESKRLLAKNPDGTTRALAPVDFYKAGAMTGLVAAFTEGPIDFYKSQLQVQIIRSRRDPTYKAPFTTFLGCIKQSFQQNGVRAPFQGLGPTLVRNIPANAVYLGTFELCKQKFAERLNCKAVDLPAPYILTSAAAGAFGYWFAIFPVDVIKSSMQSDSMIRSERKYTDMLTTAKLLWSQGGIKRFYTGFAPCLMRAAPANGAMLYTVDKVTAYLNR